MKWLFAIIVILATPAIAQKESLWVERFCQNNQAHMVTMLVDCLTDEYAIEFDFSKKWAEAIGQSLYYASQTYRKPGYSLSAKTSAVRNIYID